MLPGDYLQRSYNGVSPRDWRLRFTRVMMLNWLPRWVWLAKPRLTNYASNKPVGIQNGQGYIAEIRNNLSSRI